MMPSRRRQAWLRKDGALQTPRQTAPTGFPAPAAAMRRPPMRRCRAGEPGMRHRMRRLREDGSGMTRQMRHLRAGLPHRTAGMPRRLAGAPGTTARTCRLRGAEPGTTRPIPRLLGSLPGTTAPMRCRRAGPARRGAQTPPRRAGKENRTVMPRLRVEVHHWANTLRCLKKSIPLSIY
jgi:hypothetical protein